ncbi:uncharacterized protein EDB91DRAFT_1045900 [Suillus paluster]|uniref:uncharacterized protein n=1 Tax=Suillus paluster TaxID=48578 RepID=UPI001B872EA6|nr:uncharacterized protein EDB91DRAFT_1045900 [Suillus paluster]KAG1750545.1 hypothetical protein EDB91DRAFT_1045900 [Suillus paluster]
MFQSDTMNSDLAKRTEEHPNTTTANLDTPGQEFPGSYPGEPEQEQQQQPRGDGSEGPTTVASVVHAAKQYIPEQMERTVETATTYIPQGIKNAVHYLSPDKDSQAKGTHSEQHLSTSLPSSELKGAQPCEHVGGVGSLPGTISESSVALLPDERAEKGAQTPVNLKKDDTQIQGGNRAKNATYPVGAAVAGKPEVSTSPSLPLHLSSFSIQYGSQTDPPQLDTTPTTQHPAKLSDPKLASCETTPKHEVPEGQRSRYAEATGIGGAAMGAAQTRDQQPGETAESKAAKTAVAGGAVGHDTDYHSAKLHPLRAGEGADQAESQSGSPVSLTSAPSASETNSPKERRVSFLDKVRGEAKIIAGKMSGKEGKVQEGKRIMHGEV